MEKENFKSTGNLFDDLMYQGFEEVVTSLGCIAEYYQGNMAVWKETL